MRTAPAAALTDPLSRDTSSSADAGAAAPPALFPRLAAGDFLTDADDGAVFLPLARGQSRSPATILRRPSLTRGPGSYSCLAVVPESLNEQPKHGGMQWCISLQVLRVTRKKEAADLHCCAVTKVLPLHSLSCTSLSTSCELLLCTNTCAPVWSCVSALRNGLIMQSRAC